MAYNDPFDPLAPLAGIRRRGMAPIFTAGQTPATHVPQAKPPTFGIGSYMKGPQPPLTAAAIRQMAGSPAGAPQPLAAPTPQAAPAAPQQPPVAQAPAQPQVQQTQQRQQPATAPMGPTLYEAGSNNAMPQAQGNSFDLAGQNARMRAALDAGNALASAPGGTQEPGYRGPLAPGRDIGGDFDFATNAAARFLTSRGSAKEIAANAPAAEKLQNIIAQRDAAARGDIPLAEYGKNQLAQAQAGETVGRTKNAAALLPSEIGVKQSQAQENLARVPLSLAQAGEATARGNRLAQLAPAEVAKMNAETGEATARGGLYGAQALATTSDAGNRSLLAPGAYEQQRQTTKKGALDLKAAQDLDVLRQGALAGDPKAIKAFAQYMKANAGKGDGSITEEDIITAFVNDRKAQAANPSAGPQQSYQEFKAQIMGNGAAPPKGVPEGSIAEYNGQKKVYKGGQWVDYK